MNRRFALIRLLFSVFSVYLIVYFVYLLSCLLTLTTFFKLKMFLRRIFHEAISTLNVL